MWSIRDLRGSREAGRLAKELPLRVRAVELHLVKEAASFLLARVSALLRRTNEDYSDRLRVDRVKLGSAAYVIRLRPRSSKLDSLDPARCIVYVRRRRAPLSPAVQILAANSPWPVDALPFRPEAKEARLVYRRVSRDEVQRIRKARKGDERRWGPELSRLGALSPDRPKQPAPGSAVEDAVFQALRLEYGSRASAATPHWRPALRDLRRHIAGWLRRREVRRTLTDPSFSGWRRWLRREPDIPFRSLRKYRAFAKRITRPA